MVKELRVKTNLYREIQERPALLDFLEGNEDLSFIFDLLSELKPQRRELYKQLYQGIGNTPVYNLLLDNDNQLNIKLECENQMGNNHYSRYWLIHLALAEAFEIIEIGRAHV